MSMPGEQVFVKGDRVVSFKGELATVTDYVVVDDPSKSNRVYVQYDGDPEPQATAFYAKVFSKVED